MGQGAQRGWRRRLAGNTRRGLRWSNASVVVALVPAVAVQGRAAGLARAGEPLPLTTLTRRVRGDSRRSLVWSVAGRFRVQLVLMHGQVFVKN